MSMNMPLLLSQYISPSFSLTQDIPLCQTSSIGSQQFFTFLFLCRYSTISWSLPLLPLSFIVFALWYNNVTICFPIYLSFSFLQNSLSLSTCFSFPLTSLSLSLSLSLLITIILLSSRSLSLKFKFATNLCKMYSNSLSPPSPGAPAPSLRRVDCDGVDGKLSKSCNGDVCTATLFFAKNASAARSIDALVVCSVLFFSPSRRLKMHQKCFAPQRHLAEVHRADSVTRFGEIIAFLAIFKSAFGCFWEVFKYLAQFWTYFGNPLLFLRIFLLA